MSINQLIVNVYDLEQEFKQIPSIKMTKPLAYGVLNGKTYQIQVILTTDEDEFIDIENKTND